VYINIYVDIFVCVCVYIYICRHMYVMYMKNIYVCIYICGFNSLVGRVSLSLCRVSVSQSLSSLGRGTCGLLHRDSA
jgi:hypothetical protein